MGSVIIIRTTALGVLCCLMSAFTCYRQNNLAKDSDSCITTIRLDSSYQVLKGYKPYELSQSDVDSTLLLLQAAVFKYNNSPESGRLGRIHYENYCFQLLGGVTKNGVKEVYVNGVCSSYNIDKSLWKKELLKFNDGGNCFFNVTINLSEKSSRDFFVNGY